MPIDVWINSRHDLERWQHVLLAPHERSFRTPLKFSLAHQGRNMPRKIKSLPCIIAMSPNMLAAACGISQEKVRAAVLAGILPVYSSGNQKRILVSDAEAFIRSWHKKPARKAAE
jgi:hypothetical protein